MPFGTRLSGQNRISYKNLGNFQLKIQPKVKPKPVEPIVVPVRRIVHPVQYIDAEPSHQRPREPTVFEVEPTTHPPNSARPVLTLNFRSVSSDLRLSHEHVPHKPQHVQTKSVDEPRIVIKEVNIPVIQEIFEYITPKRYFVREIRPVIEIRNQMIAARPQLIGQTIRDLEWPLDMDMIGQESNKIVDKPGLQCLQLEPLSPFDTPNDFYNGQTPYDMRYNSSRSYMSYYKSNNLLFNIMRKYKD